MLPQVMDHIAQQLEVELKALKKEASVLTLQQGRVRQEREAIMSRLRQTTRQIAGVEAAQQAAQEREDYEAAEELVARTTVLGEQAQHLERASTQLTRELERLSDQRLQLQERQADMWARSASIMERELIKRRSYYMKEAESATAMDARAEEALLEQFEGAAPL